MTIIFNRVATATQQSGSIDALSAQRAAIAKTQRELSTGKKEFTDATAVLSVRALEKFLSDGDRYALSADVLEYRLNLAELSLSSGIDLLQRARELTIYANNASVNPEARRAAANEIDSLREDILRLANSRDAFGEHIFAGSQVDRTPFGPGADGQIEYSGDDLARSVRVSEARLIRDGFSGRELFMGDSGRPSVFATLGDLSELLRSAQTSASPLEETGVYNRLLQEMDDALGALSDARSVTGTRLLALQQINEFRNEQIDIARETLAKISDVDFAEAIARLNQQITALQVAQQTYAKAQTASLFDYL